MWAVIVRRDAQGKVIEGRVPLDPSPPVYRIATRGGRIVGYRANGAEYAQAAEEHLVSHFATCPKASEFSGAGKSADRAG